MQCEIALYHFHEGNFDAVYRLYAAVYFSQSRTDALNELRIWLDYWAAPERNMPGWKYYLEPLLWADIDSPAIDALSDAIRYATIDPY
ncbi:MAG: hypothetical protein ACRER2_18635 [Methylococcales bacterium]